MNINQKNILVQATKKKYDVLLLNFSDNETFFYQKTNNCVTTALTTLVHQSVPEIYRTKVKLLKLFINDRVVQFA